MPRLGRFSEGTRHDLEFRLYGRGVLHRNDHGKGDLNVVLLVATPGKLTKVQRELLRQLSETMTVENTPASRSLFSKVKDIFS